MPGLSNLSLCRPVSLTGLDSAGNVWAWGDGYYGQLGDGANNSRSSGVEQINGLTNITAIAAGNNHSLALDSGGILWSWGRDNVGQLGCGITNDANVPSGS